MLCIVMHMHRVLDERFDTGDESECVEKSQRKTNAPTTTEITFVSNEIK